jgi:hypothetical protein
MSTETSSSELKGARVLMLIQRGWGTTIGHYLAQQLQGEGCVLAAVTLKQSTDDFARAQTDVKYEEILYHDRWWNDPWTTDGVRSLSLETVCDELGIPSVWPLIAAKRHYVRDYGKRYFYSFRQGRSDEDAAAYVKATYLEFKGLLDRFKPDVIVGVNFSATYQMILHLMAEKRVIPMVGIGDTKISGVSSFTNDPYNESGGFVERIDELAKGKLKSANEQKAIAYVEAFRNNFQQPKYFLDAMRKPNLRRKIRDLIIPSYLSIKYIFRRPVNRNPKIGPSVDYRPPRILIRDQIAHWWNTRSAYRRDYANVPSGKFAFFPLQVQPEATLEVMAPYFTNQIETARLVAQSLPGDFVLVVKDHPWMVGRRKNSYYEKIALSPNVKLVDPRLSSEEMLQKATIVISPNSTTIAEAAFMRVPAIHFGTHGSTRRLPNVTQHKNLTTLPSKIVQVLCTPFDDQYEQQLINYVAAAYDAGFETDYVGAYYKGNASAQQIVWQAYRYEIKRVMSHADELD